MKTPFLFIALSLISLSVLGVLGGPLADDSGCRHGAIVSEEFYIGEHKNVRVKRTSCAESSLLQARAPSFEARQISGVSSVAHSVVTSVARSLSTSVVPSFVTSFAHSVASSVAPTFATSIAHSFATSVLSSPTGVTRSSVAPLSTPTGINVCGAQCTTNCFAPSGGGPDPNDCHVIADALRFDSQNVGLMFGIPSGPTDNPIVMTYKSCETFFVNQFNQDLVYCRTDWAAVIDFVAPNCQATQNAHGGDCVAGSQEWFIQVQHS